LVQQILRLAFVGVEAGEAVEVGAKFLRHFDHNQVAGVGSRKYINV
jgi:hypothetical protein